MATISLFMIGQDEENCVLRNLTGCVPYFDEIVFVDGGSVDNTRALVSTIPKLRLIDRPFNRNFGESYNFAASQCNGDWVFLKDCDEVLDIDLLTSLQRYIELGSDCYAFNRKTYIDGYLIVLDPEWCPRLWRNGKGIGYDTAMHSFVTGYESLRKTNGTILHIKTAAEQQKDNELYWDMGQVPPPGWEKVEGKWVYHV